MEEVKENRIVLDHKKPGEDEQFYFEFLDQFVVGQDFAKKKLAQKFANLNNRIISGNKPASAFLFLGPAGTGKNHLIRTFARLVYNDPDAIVRVNCALFSESMISQERLDFQGFIRDRNSLISSKNKEIYEKNLKIDRTIVFLSKKTESETEEEKELTKKRIDSLIEEKKKNSESLKEFSENIKPNIGNYVSIVVFDGVDEMHPGVTNILKQIVSRGFYVNAEGYLVDFSNSFLFFNCNLFSENIDKIFSGKNIITLSPLIEADKKKTGNEYRKTIEPAKRAVPLELLKEIGKEGIIVFRPLTKDNIRNIIRNRLSQISAINTTSNKNEVIKIFFTNKLIEFILEEVNDKFNKTLGASSVDRVIQQKITEPIFRLINKKDGIKTGDEIEIDATDISKTKKDILVMKIKKEAA